MSTVDARGLSCPKPIILTKQALDKITDGVVTTLVDNEVAAKNVQKLAKKLNCTVVTETTNGEYTLTITKGEQPSVSVQQILPTLQNSGGTVVFCMSDTFGQGDSALGNALLNSFFYSLTEQAIPPQTVIFMNKGIYLALADSPVLASLQDLVASGTEVMTCGACLDFYHKKEELAVGDITNMYAATEILCEAGRVIRI